MSQTKVKIKAKNPTTIAKYSLFSSSCAPNYNDTTGAFSGFKRRKNTYKQKHKFF
ncbi:hypothetical protein I79_006977 [Cricetulus griseus]|uniref:Uncharacterized protein n=1 Tax=Cricetulus griseus TaxID=10029 RepID=G3H9B0_CRIGR|nr:hypothetical protein I79_006977 [Cricetulus griseus]